MSENWVDGTYEAGADTEPTDTETLSTDDVQDGAGVEMGIEEGGSTFEPEEDEG